MTPRPARILYIASHCPAGPDFGARLRVRHLGRLLGRAGEVSLLLASVGEWTTEQLDAARAEFRLAGVIRLRDAGSGGPVARLRRALDPTTLNTHGFLATDDDRATVARLIAEHDAAWVHTLRTANAIGIRRWPHAVLDVDDLPSQLESSRAAESGSPAARLRGRLSAAVWRARERRLLDRFDAIAVCSEADRRALGGSGRVAVVRNGFEPPAPVPRRPATPPRLGFIGTLGYGPNLDGVRWFVDRVWPAVRDAHPGATLRLVGEGSGGSEIGATGVEALGYVHDPADEIATWSAMIVPVRTGGGTRIKIAEAFARGCPVVSTTLGAFGYEARDGRDLLLADTPEAMAHACRRVIEDPALAESLARRGLALFEARYSWDASAGAVAGLIARVARGRAAAESTAPALTPA